MIACGVAQRTQEIGVRVAVGAQTGQILRLVVGEGVRLTATGIVIGCGIMLAASGLFTPLRFAETPRDPVVFGTVGTALLVVASAASMIPAWRASRIDPTITLRND